MFKIIALLLILSCSTSSTSGKLSRSEGPKDFSPRELITSAGLLTKIYDEVLPPLSCVPDAQAAELLLRTIRPRLEVVMDDIEALLDQDSEIDALIRNCQSDCMCEFIDEVFREHQLALTKGQAQTLQKGIKGNEKVCLSQRAETFCESTLFKELNKEKGDFSFE